MKSEINVLIKWVLELADLFDSDEEVKEMLRKKLMVGSTGSISTCLRSGVIALIELKSDYVQSSSELKWLIGESNNQFRQVEKIIGKGNDICIFSDSEIKQMHDAVAPLITKWESEYEE